MQSIGRNSISSSLFLLIKRGIHGKILPMSCCGKSLTKKQSGPNNISYQLRHYKITTHLRDSKFTTSNITDKVANDKIRNTSHSALTALEPYVKLMRLNRPIGKHISTKMSFDHLLVILSSHY